jgi:hypothetical protein
MYIVAFIIGFLYRFILKKFASGTVRGAQKNIGKFDRLIRLAIGVALLLWAITTSSKPVASLFSRFRTI